MSKKTQNPDNALKQKKIKEFKIIRTRKEALEYFKSKRQYYSSERDKYYCQGDNCGKELTEEEVIDDHIDNNRNNNKPNNHQPLCRSCNTHNSGKTMEQKKLIQRKRKKAFESGLNKTSGLSAQILINRVAEEKFREWVMEQIKLHETISWIDLIDAGCEYITQHYIYLSQSTAERYLRKMTSFIGPLIAIGSGDARQVELRNKSKTDESNSLRVLPQ